MGVRTFARIKHLIWDQLLASKAVFSFCVQNRTFCNLECLHCFCSLSKGIFNALKRYYVWPWNTLTVIKIVYSSPEAMVEFSGERKLKLSLSCKIYIKRSRYFFIRLKQNSPITSHAKLALCKESDTPFFVYLLKGRRVTFRRQTAFFKARFTTAPRFLFDNNYPN